MTINIDKSLQFTHTFIREIIYNTQLRIFIH